MAINREYNDPFMVFSTQENAKYAFSSHKIELLPFQNIKPFRVQLTLDRNFTENFKSVRFHTLQ